MRPEHERLALEESKRRGRDREHCLDGAIRRAVDDVLSGDHSSEAAARNRGVPAERVRAAVKAARKEPKP
jgi:hypothetical protein